MKSFPGIVTPAHAGATSIELSDIYVFTHVAVTAESPSGRIRFRALPAPNVNYVSPQQFRIDVHAAPNRMLSGDFLILDAKAGLGEFRYVRPGTSTTATAQAARPTPPSVSPPARDPNPPAVAEPPRAPAPKRPATRRPPPEMEFP